MGLTSEDVEDKAWTIIQQSGDSQDTYKQMDNDEPHHRFMGDEELPLPHHREEVVGLRSCLFNQVYSDQY